MFETPAEASSWSSTKRTRRSMPSERVRLAAPPMPGHPEPARRAREPRDEAEVEPVGTHRRIVGNRAPPGFARMAR